MAYIKLAVVHNNMGHFADRDKYAALALKHADRLTPRERYYIEGFAYSNRSDSLVRSVDSYRKCIELDVNATHVVHSGVSGNNGGYHTNPQFLEGLPNESSS